MFSKITSQVNFTWMSVGICIHTYMVGYILKMKNAVSQFYYSTKHPNGHYLHCRYEVLFEMKQKLHTKLNKSLFIKQNQKYLLLSICLECPSFVWSLIQ